MGQIFAIGDIHGCIAPLRRLLSRIDIRWGEDRLVFMGDYIDRGESTVEVLDLLIQLKGEHPETVFLKGNHEEMFLAFLSGQHRPDFLINGGQQTLDSYARRGLDPQQGLPKEHLDFLKELVLFHESEAYIFVHAGVRPGIPLGAQVSEDLLWIREPFVRGDARMGKRVVFGHTHFREPLVMSDKIGIDTGAVYGNLLTCVRLPDLTFFSE